LNSTNSNSTLKKTWRRSLRGGNSRNSSRRKKTETDIRNTSRIVRILRDIARGMKGLHDVELVHRDLKPSNIMIDSNFRARIGDFNLSALLQKNTTNQLPTGAGMVFRLKIGGDYPEKTIRRVNRG